MSGYDNYDGRLYYNGTDLSDIDWSQVTGGEWFTIAYLIFSILLCLITTILLIIKRDYPPVKAKQVPLQIVCGISAILCQFGSADYARLFPQRSIFLLNGGCYGFGIWTTFVLGGMLFCDTLIFTMLRLYFIFVLRRMPSTLQQVLIFLMMWLYPLLFGIATTALHSDGPDVSSATGFSYPECDLSYGAIYAVIVFYTLMILSFLYLAVALRKIPRKAFAEYQTNRNLFIFFIVVYIVVVAIAIQDDGYQQWGKIVAVLLIAVALDVVFLARIGVPLYHSVVDPEEYRAVFFAQMNNSDDIRVAASKLDLNATHGRKSKQTTVTNSTSTIDMNTSKVTLNETDAENVIDQDDARDSKSVSIALTITET